MCYWLILSFLSSLRRGKANAHNSQSEKRWIHSDRRVQAWHVWRWKEEIQQPRAEWEKDTVPRVHTCGVEEGEAPEQFGELNYTHLWLSALSLWRWAVYQYSLGIASFEGWAHREDLQAFELLLTFSFNWGKSLVWPHFSLNTDPG